MSMLNDASLLRLLQLVSPSLPVGAYAYSQGLEYAVETQWLKNEADVQAWLLGLMKSNMCCLDIPVLLRLHRAWSAQDVDAVAYWNEYLLACRETAELQSEDKKLAAALLRLLTQLELSGVDACVKLKPTSYAAMFSFAATRYDIPERTMALGYMWSWLENQVAAAIKLVPLGQTSGQRILSHLLNEMPMMIDQALAIDDEEIGYVAPGMVMASAAHETQYSRLFQS